MITVTLQNFESPNSEHLALAERAASLVGQAVNHPEFKPKVLTARYRETRFRDSNGRLSHKKPDEIAAIILAGMERGTADDAEIDLAIRVDPSIEPDVVGVTTPGKLPFRTGKWFFDLAVEKNDAISVARHMMHEWLHVAGFVHKRNNGYRKDVAYLVGGIVRDLLRQGTGTEKSLTGEREDAEVAAALDASLDHVHEE